MAATWNRHPDDEFLFEVARDEHGRALLGEGIWPEWSERAKRAQAAVRPFLH